MNKPVNTLIPFGALLLGVLSVLPLSSQAFSLGITVKGAVISPPCTINDGNDITINFGQSIVVESIDGKNYEAIIPYFIKCPAGSSTLLKLQLAGPGAPFDASLLQTSKTNLAIQLKTDAHKLDLNRWQNFTYASQPALSAVLMRNGTGRITLGAFTATATLMVEYQ